MFDQISTVVERGFVSRVEYERRRQTLINSQQALSSFRQQHASRHADVAGASAQLASVKIESDQGAAELQSSMQGMRQQQAELEGQQAYVINAPISGRVTAIQTAQGRTANPNVPLMVIVPEQAELRAELYAPTRAIGFVEAGQETRLLFDAFPYQRFGSFGGRVQSVSRIVIDPRETEVPLRLEEPVYRIIVALDRQTAATFARGVSLQPGMTLQATIVLERQTFLQWLLQPLNAVLNRTS